MEKETIESFSESVVREYLSRKGLKRTLSVMDEECPRRALSISNRGQLAEALQIQHLVKANKIAPVVFRTIIEIIVKDLIPKQEIDDVPASVECDQVEDNRSGNHGNDLVLDDALDDGETLVGEGRAGLMGKTQQPSNDPAPLITRKSKATSKFVLDAKTMDTSSVLTPSGGRQSQQRSRGLMGQISSSIDDRDKHRMMRNKSGRGSNRTAIGRSSPPLLLDDPKPVRRTNEVTRTNFNTDTTQNDILEKDFTSKFQPEPKRTLNHRANDNKSLESILSADVNSRLENKTKISRRSLQDPQVTDTHDYDLSKSSLTSDSRTNSSCSSHSTTSTKPRHIMDTLTSGKSSKHKQNYNRFDDLELGDLDDLDQEVHDLDLEPRMPLRQPSFMVESEPLDIKTAVDLKTLVLGSAQQVFNDEWKYQSFTFCDLPKLQYGFVQKKGGPCGVLASVQACLLKELLFREGQVATTRDLVLGRHKRSEMLAAALAAIFWRCGACRAANVVLPGKKSNFPGSSRIKTDGLIETLMVYKFDSKQDLQTFLHQNIGQFELDGSSGVILALYSAVLSRTIKTVGADMDEPNGTLVAAHDYCSQDLVNLLTTGRASSNVFNDVVELDGGQGSSTVLHGVKGRAEVGLLSLFEHYKSCQVGTYMKTPYYPIWVVCSESHFSVLFSLKKALLSDWKAEKRFDLYYYDGLAKQDAEIRLSIDTTNRFFEAPAEADLVPPLEHCIRTKWPDAEIDWNGTEPLL